MSLVEMGKANGSALEAEEPLDTERLYFAGFGIVLPMVIACGVVGNILTLIVLTRPNFQAVSYIYLRWLAVSDLFAMICWIPSIFTMGYHMPIKNIHVANYMAHVDIPLANTFLASSALLVCALTVERHISVCYPVRAHTLVTKKRAFIVVICIYLSCAILYTPETVRYVIVEETVNNVTIYNAEAFNPDIFNDTESGIYKVFSVYTKTLTVITKFVPIILVALLNSVTLCSFRRLALRRHRSFRRKFQEQERIMILLICVVVVFVVCLTPMAILYLIYSEEMKKKLGFHIFRVMANILETCNSALNFYIYCMASRDFRKHLRSTFACGKEPVKTLSTYTPAADGNSEFPTAATENHVSNPHNSCSTHKVNKDVI